jgi:hypothetical protein
MDARSLVEDLIAVTSRLAAVLERENELLRQMQPSKIAAFQDDKLSLANVYQALVREIARDPARLAALESALRTELEKALARFSELASANAKAIRAAQEVNRRVMLTIVNAVKARQAQAVGYARDGRRSSVPAEKAPVVSLGVNQRL